MKFADFALIVLIGPRGAGKTYFAKTNFRPDQIVSLAEIQTMTGDDGTDEARSEATLNLLHSIIDIRLQHRLTTIVDANLIRPKDRNELRRLARKHHLRLSALVLDTPYELCIERLQATDDHELRQLLRAQIQVLDETANFLKDEGLRSIYRIQPDQGPFEIKWYKAASDLKDVSGPFDIIGDVHGCLAELVQLIEKLGYTILRPKTQTESFAISHSKDRKLIFVGDLCDRGPDSPGVFRLVMDLVKAGMAYCVPGNHDDKLKRWLQGNQVQLKHGLETTVAQLAQASIEMKEEMREFIDRLSPHLEFDGGKLVVAHAGLKLQMHGRSSGEIQSFCLYGETTGETDEFGLPVRHNWAGEYEGKALVVYGHTPIPEPLWQNNTVNIDTGCVFGGELTALRYPERTTVSVPALKTYAEPRRPIHWNNSKSLNARIDHAIDDNFVNSKILVATTDGYHITLEERIFANLLAHLTVSGVHNRWLIHIPTSVSPPTPSQLPGLLEHPAQAVDYYRKKSETQLFARPLHLGTQVVIVLCKNNAVAARKFQLIDQGIGAVYTRSARPYFEDKAQEQTFLSQMAGGLEKADFWSQMQTDWICLEAVVTPIGARAPHFIPQVYAEVAAATRDMIPVAQEKLKAAQGRGLVVAPISEQLHRQAHGLDAFRTAYHQIASAPVQWHLHQVIGFEGQVILGQSQLQHQATLERIASALPDTFAQPEYLQADVDSESSLRELNAWWERLNHEGKAGLLIGPLIMRFSKDKDLVQPWIKVRCPQHLRLLFGPNYDAPATLESLRERNLRFKRETAVRSYSLTKDGMATFVKGESFNDVFSKIFTCLGLEMAASDPRL